MSEGKTVDGWAVREAHNRKVRAERRGFPAEKDRPLCLCGCKRRLEPDFAVDRSSGQYLETNVLRGWKGYGNVFKTLSCAERYARRQQEARTRADWNMNLIDKLNEGRKK